MTRTRNPPSTLYHSILSPDEIEQVTNESNSRAEGVSELDDVTKDITEAKSPSSFYFDEKRDDSKSEQMWSSQKIEQINQFSRFKSLSVPTSPQTSPVPSPDSSPPSFQQHIHSDIFVART